MVLMQVGHNVNNNNNAAMILFVQSRQNVIGTLRETVMTLKADTSISVLWRAKHLLGF